MTCTGWAIEFIDGVHLQNHDDQKYVIVVSVNPMSVSMCDVKHPTPKVKQGLVGIQYKSNVKGLKILPKAFVDYFPLKHPWFEDIVRAEVEPHTNIECVCENSCEIQIVNVMPKKVVPNRSTIIIQEGKASIHPL